MEASVRGGDPCWGERGGQSAGEEGTVRETEAQGGYLGPRGPGRAGGALHGGLQGDPPETGLVASVSVLVWARPLHLP